MTEEFVIQSDINNLALVEERVFHFCNTCNVGNYYAAVQMAVQQAVANAIVHGNGCNNSKQVHITLGQYAGGVFAEVHDEGIGFDYLQYGSLQPDTNMGNGIFVMQRLSDRMTFADGGSTVRMEFVVMGVDPTIAHERVDVLQRYLSPVLV